MAAFEIHNSYVPEKWHPSPTEAKSTCMEEIPLLDVPVQRCGTVILTPLLISASRIPRQATGCGGEKRGDDTWNRFQGNTEVRYEFTVL